MIDISLFSGMQIHDFTQVNLVQDERSRGRKQIFSIESGKLIIL
jgi:hypothetical protein